jgi:hypothetical protein
VISDRAASREAALYALKLEALATARWGPDERVPERFEQGAALVAWSSESPGIRCGLGPESWLYLPKSIERGVGGLLAWAVRIGVAHVHVLVDTAVDGELGVLARQARQILEPVLDVWRISGEKTVLIEPVPLTARRKPEPAPDLIDVLIDARVEVVVEDGIVRGEVNGLEVARIVHGTTMTPGVPVDGPFLEVGVGAADRELTAMLHGTMPPVDQLARVVDIVRQHRQAEAPFHPLNQLVPERWLRAKLCRSPDLIGLDTLRPIEAPRPRPNLRDRDIAVAVGDTPDLRSVVVACSVGVDLELVPAAADAREAIDPEAELWLVVPERDVHPTTRQLATAVRRHPARIVPVADDWRS